MTRTRRTQRQRIIEAAAELLAEGGRDAVSTRSVSAAAGVTAPAIYRQFGDMRGLLDAVAAHGFAAYQETKPPAGPADDPVEELRHGWDMHVAFGLANPRIYALMYGEPRGGEISAPAERADAVLRGIVERIAAAGRLSVSVEHATGLMHAGALGVTVALLEAAPEDRDLTLSDATREALLAAITTDGPTPASADGTQPSVMARAVALKATLDAVAPAFSSAELKLLSDWLDRIARQDQRRFP
jgi:AcrR family transcriptional regulator